MSDRRDQIQACWPTALPSPEALAEYDRLVPGAAERILSMTERTVTGEIDVANKLANAETHTAKMSLSVTAGLTLLAFAASATFFAFGNKVAGIAFASFLMVLLVGSLVPRSSR